VGGVVSDDGGKGLTALRVRRGDKSTVGGVEQGDDAVGGAQVDADRLADVRRGRGHGWARQGGSREGKKRNPPPFGSVDSSALPRSRPTAPLVQGAGRRHVAAAT
jgi:hypothetical protein